MTKKKDRYKSEFERQGAKYIAAKEGKVSYEPVYFPYVLEHNYTPDFVLRNGIILEYKGRFVGKDRTKHLHIKKQYPELDIRFVFMAPNNKLSKASKKTYADWCEKYGFKWCQGNPPDEWFEEQSK